MSSPAAPSFQEIEETFELMDDWEDRYRYVIDLGKGLAGLPEAKRTAANKVEGCASQVWLDLRIEPDAAGERRFHFEGDSDAHIVRGLIAVLHALLSGKPLREVAETDAIEAFSRLGLASQLSAQRSNGLRAMAARIRSAAEAATAQ